MAELDLVGLLLDLKLTLCPTVMEMEKHLFLVGSSPSDHVLFPHLGRLQSAGSMERVGVNKVATLEFRTSKHPRFPELDSLHPFLG